jgi:hypothetical protein
MRCIECPKKCLVLVLLVSIPLCQRKILWLVIKRKILATDGGLGRALLHLTFLLFELDPESSALYLFCGFLYLTIIHP